MRFRIAGFLNSHFGHSSPRIFARTRRASSRVAGLLISVDAVGDLAVGPPTVGLEPLAADARLLGRVHRRAPEPVCRATLDMRYLRQALRFLKGVEDPARVHHLAVAVALERGHGRPFRPPGIWPAGKSG